MGQNCTALHNSCQWPGHSAVSQNTGNGKHLEKQHGKVLSGHFWMGGKFQGNI